MSSSEVPKVVTCNACGSSQVSMQELGSIQVYLDKQVRLKTAKIRIETIKECVSIADNAPVHSEDDMGWDMRARVVKCLQKLLPPE